MLGRVLGIPEFQTQISNFSNFETQFICMEN